MTDDQFNQIMAAITEVDRRVSKVAINLSEKIDHLDGKLDHIVDNMVVREEQTANNERLVDLEKRIETIEQFMKSHQSHAA